MAQQHDYYRLSYTYVNNDQDALDGIENMIVIVYEKLNSYKNQKLFIVGVKRF